MLERQHQPGHGSRVVGILVGQRAPPPGGLREVVTILGCCRQRLQRFAIGGGKPGSLTLDPLVQLDGAIEEEPVEEGSPVQAYGV